jgi:hypothetical protein
MVGNIDDAAGFGELLFEDCLVDEIVLLKC